jgi:hypothetical protein
MEATVQWVIIFSLALRTHLEVAHGGLGTVIRDVLNNGKAGAAISAVDKGIPEPPIGGGKKFALAGFTGSNIWRHQLIFSLLGIAASNLKAGIAFRREGGSYHPLNSSHRWSFNFESADKPIYCLFITFHLYLYAT